jgi:hypothetical protein
MFPFIKPNISGATIANEFFFRPLREGYDAGFPRFKELFPTETQIPKECVNDEWLWLEVFTVDFSTYLALGMTEAKAAVLTPFWRELKIWLQGKEVAALPERLAVIGGGPRSIPAEVRERGYDRPMRRMKDYSTAVVTPHSQGENYSVAGVFANACGFFDAVAIMGVSGFFSSRKIEYVKFLRSQRISS